MEKDKIPEIYFDKKGLENLCDLLGKNKEDIKPTDNLPNFMDYILHALVRNSVKDLTRFFYKELKLSGKDNLFERYIKRNRNVRCTSELIKLAYNPKFIELYKKHFIDKIITQK